ncbi:MAG: hypothetical protein LWX54_17205 [Deltaproteobacteria bacterium]|nr:hypothetical protein [Deltaproteobacteria bacterium]
MEAAKYLKHMNIQLLKLISWSSRPTYDNILASSQIIWDQLNGAAAARRSAVYNAKMMTYWIWELYKNRSVSKFRKKMINSQIDRDTNADDAVENVLSFLRGWASFNYPKYLKALGGIANYILNKRGLTGCDYTPFAVSIEHLFQPDSFSSLEEYGLPFEISQKLLEHSLFDKRDELDDVVASLRRQELSGFADGIFEKRVIEDFQQGIGARIIVKETNK